MRTKFALAFLVVLATAAASAQTMTQYQYPSDGFRASYPSEPRLDKHNVPTDAGTFELRSYVAEPGQAALFIGVCDYGSSVSGSDPAKLLQGAKNGALQNSKSHLVDGSEKLFTFQGYPALEFQAESDAGHFRARIYMVGTTLYQTLVVAPLGSPYPGTQQFLDSFALIPRAK
jgi:hypothetical protein